MSNRNLMGRRQFLVVSSTCALATAAIGPKLFAGEVASSPKRLAVGFASFGESPAVGAASRIPSSDSGFLGRGARIVVSGASGASETPHARRMVELLAHYSHNDGGEVRTTPFRAWGCSRVTGCQGNSVGFHVPLDDAQKILFTVGAETGTPEGSEVTRRGALVEKRLESTALPLVLSVPNEDGALKLARGYYVVVPLFEDDSDPRWSGWTLRAVDGRMSLVDGSGSVAPFEHFVLRVDYATV